MCPYSESFWFAFSRIRTEYGGILRISPYSVRMRENADQNNSEYGHFLRSDSGFGNYIACKGFAVQTLLWSLEFVIRKNFEHGTIAVKKIKSAYSMYLTKQV